MVIGASMSSPLRLYFEPLYRFFFEQIGTKRILPSKSQFNLGFATVPKNITFCIGTFEATWRGFRVCSNSCGIYTTFLIKEMKFFSSMSIHKTLLPSPPNEAW
jgi:hypothetical protein